MNNRKSQSNNWSDTDGTVGSARSSRQRGPTCQVQGEGDEAVVASQELQRLLPLHQSAKVISQGFTIEEVVDANQEVPAAPHRGGGGSQAGEHKQPALTHGMRPEVTRLKTEPGQSSRHGSTVPRPTPRIKTLLSCVGHRPFQSKL